MKCAMWVPKTGFFPLNDLGMEGLLEFACSGAWLRCCVTALGKGAWWQQRFERDRQHGLFWQANSVLVQLLVFALHIGSESRAAATMAPQATKGLISGSLLFLLLTKLLEGSCEMWEASFCCLCTMQSRLNQQIARGVLPR